VPRQAPEIASARRDARDHRRLLERGRRLAKAVPRSGPRAAPARHAPCSLGADRWSGSCRTRRRAPAGSHGGRAALRPSGRPRPAFLQSPCVPGARVGRRQRDRNHAIDRINWAGERTWCECASSSRSGGPGRDPSEDANVVVEPAHRRGRKQPRGALLHPLRTISQGPRRIAPQIWNSSARP